MQLDISVSDRAPCEAALWQKTMSESWPPLRPLVVCLKTLLRHRKLADVSSGGLSSFSLVNMVLSLLQTTPGQRDLGTLLAAFLKLFGKDFNYWVSFAPSA